MSGVGRFLAAVIFGALVGIVGISYSAVVCTALGTTTPNISLCKPAAGETGWDTAINNNWTVIDSLLPGALTAANGAIEIGNGSGFSLNTITGTTNQVTVTNGAGTITLSLPQNIHTGATPQFAGVGIGAAAVSGFLNWSDVAFSRLAANVAELNTGVAGVTAHLRLRTLRATQATPPTCLDSSSINACSDASGSVGSDSILAIKINNTIAGSTRNLTVTFNASFAVAPSCVASWDGTITYGYYVQAVTTSTTTAVIKLGGAPGVGITPVIPSWSPHDKASLHCFGVS